MFNMENQQGPAGQHGELCSMSHGSLDGRGVWRRTDTHVCVAESCCCSLKHITTLLLGYTQGSNPLISHCRRANLPHCRRFSLPAEPQGKPNHTPIQNKKFKTNKKKKTNLKNYLISALKAPEILQPVPQMLVGTRLKGAWTLNLVFVGGVREC